MQSGGCTRSGGRARNGDCNLGGECFLSAGFTRGPAGVFVVVGVVVTADALVAVGAFGVCG